ncbi:MAG: hypothetical protein ACXWKM_14275, partial [Phenylobacterium sp.]
LAWLGLLIMGVSIPLALLPGHLGVPLFAVGLVLTLRNSFSARRKFIELQRRQPKFVHPIRRLIRREPEVIPVIWQQMLRSERWVLPRKIRFFKKVRLALMSRRRRQARAAR